MLPKQLSTNHIGIAFIVLGALLLIFRMTGSLWGIITSLWPLVLIAVGYYQLKIANNARQAYIFMLVGSILLLFTLNILKLINIFGPVALILAGVYLLARGSKGITSFMLGGFAKAANLTVRRTMRGLKSIFKPNPSQKEDFQQNINGPNISANAVFRSSSYVATSFSNGSGRCILGDLDVDLRQAKPKGDVVYMSVTCNFGYASIKIPTDWQVETVNTKFLGDVINHSQQKGNVSTTLKLNTHCFFGDISISN